MVEDEEVFKYPEDVHVKTNYMVEGTDFSNWNNIWYVSNAYKKHMSPTKSLFKRLKSRFRMEQTQHEKKFIFSHGIGEAVVETNENEIVIPCVLYTPEVTLNVLSLDQLLAQGFVITYGHDKCRISYMFGEDKKVYDGESDYGKGKGCDVKTESMIAKQNKYLEEYFDSIDPKDACPLIKGLEELKWNRNMVQDYLDDDYISVNGTLYAIKCYYETTLRAWYKEGLVKYEETKEVEIGCDHAKEGNPQEHVGQCDNETDDDQVTDQKDGGNTLEKDDFVVIT
ncbi:hypothetical protein Tco_1233243 [Tanacetum coccineum]